jgi:hypothetical protein
MTQDMLDLLRLDPGTRTMGELVQEREWAYGEITRLRRENAQQVPPHLLAAITGSFRIRFPTAADRASSRSLFTPFSITPEILCRTYL